MIRAMASLACFLVALGLAVGLLFERQACARLNEENQAARQQLSQMDKLLSENQRLAKLIAGALPSRLNQQAGSPLAEEENELLRLRNEVKTLQQQIEEMAMLRADTRQVRTASEGALTTKAAQIANDIKNVNHININPNYATPNSSQFDVLSAQYWTDKTNLDVAAELRERIRGDSLKAVANNNIKGDPDFGEVKHLTVVYRYGSTLFTNEFREGEFVVLPKPIDQ